MKYDDFRKGCKGIADAILIVAGALLGTLIYRFLFGGYFGSIYFEGLFGLFLLL